MPCFTAMRAEIALMSGSAFAVTHHAFSSGAGRTSDGNGSHASTLKSPSYTKSVSWQHYPFLLSFLTGGQCQSERPQAGQLAHLAHCRTPPLRPHERR
ncbi:putative transposase [Shigella flexneri K-1770]|nr:putative transposase [Shigella flexneri K-1770]